MQTVIANYLAKLREYAAYTRVPGLDVASAPIPLAHIFIEPDIRPKESGDRISGRPQSSADRSAPPEPAIRILARQQAVAILGGPGQGKSTLLRHYACLLATDGPRVPILVELGRKGLRGGEGIGTFQWLYDGLPEVLKQGLGRSGWAHICNILGSGRASVLLDAFDELGTKAQLQVRELAGELGMNQVIVTSRDYVYGIAPFAGFQVYRLCRLNARQVELLATHTCQALARQFGVDHEPALRKVVGVAREPATQLARNPLLLSFMCLTAVKRHSENSLDKFPIRSAPLIGECVDALVAWHKRHKPAKRWPDTLDFWSVASILGPLALRSFKDGSGVISPEALALIGEEKKKQFERYLVPAGFVEQSYSDYIFPIQTFREYFAAREVALRQDPFTFLKPHLHKPEWRAVILYTAGSLNRCHASLLDRLFPFPRLTSLVIKAAGLIVRASISLLRLATKKQPVEQLSDEVTRDISKWIQDPLERWLARSRCSTEFFIAGIWKSHCMMKPYRYERILQRDLELAANCLGESPECPRRLAYQIVNSLVQVNQSFQLDGSRRFTDALLQAARCPQARQPLLELTRNGTPEARAVSCGGLGEVATEPEVRPRLLELTLDDDASVRKAATNALRAVALEADVLKRLLELTQDVDTWVQCAAIEALSGFAARPEVRERLVELMLGNCPERTLNVTGAAADALAGVATETQLQKLLLKLTYDEDWAIRGDAARALAGALTVPRVKVRLLELRKDENYMVRGDVARALLPVATEREVQECLLELASDDCLGTYLSVVEGLALGATDPRLQKRLLKLTRSGDGLLRSVGAGALRAVVKEPEVQARMLELARDEEVCVREAAASALESVAIDPRVQINLLKLAIDDDMRVRVAAARSLAGAAANRKVQQLLLELTTDEDEWVRRTSCEALARGLSNGRVSTPVLRRIASLVRRRDAPTSTLEALVHAREQHGL
jgi:HEAT repeat protein/energy-coupling factor transporter ATP-binding protein EcfA2